MEFLSEYGLFLAKAITVVISFVVIIGAIVSAGQRNKQQPNEGHINITDISDELKELEGGIRKEVMSKDAFKNYQKQQKQADKEKAKSEKLQAKKADEKENSSEDGRVFVIDFDGDVEASGVENLREEITAILSVADKGDEVLVRLESPGGMVHTYGLASSQLLRIKSAGLKLNIAVDAVAASGGYMMACVADKIFAAPFAIIGAIGVVGQLPNFNRLLKHNKVDYEQHTAGELKRTLTTFGEVTDKERDKFREELEETHVLFKSFINDNRPSLDIEKVATGEHWYGSKALELGLIDEISTSDDLIVHASKESSVYKVKYEIKKPLSERLPISLQAMLQNVILGVWNKIGTVKYFK